MHAKALGQTGDDTLESFSYFEKAFLIFPLTDPLTPLRRTQIYSHSMDAETEAGRLREVKGPA